MPSTANQIWSQRGASAIFEGGRHRKETITSDRLPDDQTLRTSTGGASNGLAVAGFILALCAVVFYWVFFLSLFFLSFIMWVLGIVFSGIGYSRAKAPGSPGRGLAIAGLSIALGGMILSILVTIGIAVSMG